MARIPRPSRLTFSLAPAGAAVAALLAAGALAAIPGAWAEAGVVESGLPALIPAAAPPLGALARVLVALAGAGGAAAVVWAALVLVAGDRRIALRLPARGRGGADGVPAVRRADQHPDAPPRAPIRAAREFGPVPDVPSERPAEPERALPRDLDTPLLAYAADASDAVSLAPGERIASVELTPETRAEPASVETLLARLEGAGRRNARPVPRPGYAQTLEEALGALRRSAAGA